MGNIRGWRSKSAFNSVEYKRSWRALRRLKFAETRNAVRRSAPPPLFGLITDILVVLAKSGPVRRVALHEFFGEIRISRLAKIDKSGLVADWVLPRDRSPGQRGHVVGLDARFPLFKEVRAVLARLSEDFPFTAVSNLPRGERTIPERRGKYCIDKIFFSMNRLKILAALEVLGGRVRLQRLSRSVIGTRQTMVFARVRGMIADGILQKEGALLAYKRAPWTSSYRSLIRAYLALHPEIRDEVKARYKLSTKPRKEQYGITLFGYKAMQRIFVALASQGPLKTSELERVAMTGRSSPVHLRRLVTAGIIARRLVHNGGKTPYHMIGLNTAHPVHRELRNLICAIAKVEPSVKRQLRETLAEGFSVDGLFMTAQRLNILVAIGNAIHGDIDPASIGRLYPEHDILRIMEILREWNDEEILARRGTKMT